MVQLGCSQKSVAQLGSQSKVNGLIRVVVKSQWLSQGRSQKSMTQLGSQSKVNGLVGVVVKSQLLHMGRSQKSLAQLGLQSKVSCLIWVVVKSQWLSQGRSQKSMAQLGSQSIVSGLVRVVVKCQWLSQGRSQKSMAQLGCVFLPQNTTEYHRTLQNQHRPFKILLNLIKYVQKMFICLNSFDIFSCIVVEMGQFNRVVSLYRLFSGEIVYYFIILFNIYMCIIIYLFKRQLLSQ